MIFNVYTIQKLFDTNFFLVTMDKAGEYQKKAGIQYYI